MCDILIVIYFTKYCIFIMYYMIFKKIITNKSKIIIIRNVGKYKVHIIIFNKSGNTIVLSGIIRKLIQKIVRNLLSD